jgi:hypothetical protein
MQRQGLRRVPGGAVTICMGPGLLDIGNLG